MEGIDPKPIVDRVRRTARPAAARDAPGSVDQRALPAPPALTLRAMLRPGCRSSGWSSWPSAVPHRRSATPSGRRTRRPTALDGGTRGRFAPSTRRKAGPQCWATLGPEARGLVDLDWTPGRGRGPGRWVRPRSSARRSRRRRDRPSPVVGLARASAPCPRPPRRSRRGLPPPGWRAPRIGSDREPARRGSCDESARPRGARWRLARRDTGRPTPPERLSPEQAASSRTSNGGERAGGRPGLPPRRGDRRRQDARSTWSCSRARPGGAAPLSCSSRRSPSPCPWWIASRGPRRPGRRCSHFLGGRRAGYEWRRIRRGDVDVIVGPAGSAAPLGTLAW